MSLSRGALDQAVDSSDCFSNSFKQVYKRKVLESLKKFFSINKIKFISIKLKELNLNKLNNN
jgi:hypothetical protein